MCERRIEIILERFEVKIGKNSRKNRSSLVFGGGFWEVSMDVLVTKYEIKVLQGNRIQDPKSNSQKFFFLTNELRQNQS